MKHILQCHEIDKTDFVRGENCTLYDAQGRRFVDLESGIWCTVLGHNHPATTQAMHRQIDQLIHLGMRCPNQQAEKAAIALLEVLGIKSGKCTFLSSGSEAVEFGVQTVRRLTNRPTMLTFTTSYLAAYGSAGKKAQDEWLLLDWQACPAAELMERLDQLPFEEIGGFAFEPGGSGIAGVTFPPLQLVQEIVRRVRQSGGLILVNEITTGIGRTGQWFGFQHYDIAPDIVAVGKGLGNGYPVSAVALQAPIAERLEADGFRYVQSHQNDPLACAIAQAVITTLKEENLIERGNRLGGRFLDGLQQLAQVYPGVVKEARGRGMLLGLALQPKQALTAQTAYEALLEQGFLVGYYTAGNMLRFSPALTIEEQTFADFVITLENIIKSAN